ncbi:hypothetical protein AYI68_g240 [Smittium mucronatum]|uniref:Uncharacterized protein n=1 Tax=Smittium mucronatum TaxID=133383 RepID=A0A1R0H8Y9_9FUNG|nr:hypothetical protein AYI68_g240 [Smittium mucronatum]
MISENKKISITLSPHQELPDIDEDVEDIWESSESESSEDTSSSDQEDNENISMILGHPSLSKYVSKDQDDQNNDPYNSEKMSQLGDYDAIYNFSQGKNMNASTVYREKALAVIENIFYPMGTEDSAEDKSKTLEALDKRLTNSPGLSLIFEISKQKQKDKPFKDLRSAFEIPREIRGDSISSIATLTQDPKNIINNSYPTKSIHNYLLPKTESECFDLNTYLDDSYLDGYSNSNFKSYRTLWQNDSFGRYILGLGYVSKLCLDNRENYPIPEKVAEVPSISLTPTKEAPQISFPTEKAGKKANDIPSIIINSNYNDTKSTDNEDTDTSYEQNNDNGFIKDKESENLLTMYSLSGKDKQSKSRQYKKKQNSDATFLKELEKLSKPDITLIEMLNMEEEEFEIKRRNSRKQSKGITNPKNEAQMQFFEMIVANGVNGEKNGVSVGAPKRKNSYFRPIIDDENDNDQISTPINGSKNIKNLKSEQDLFKETFNLDFYDPTVGKIFLSEKEKQEHDQNTIPFGNKDRKASLNITFVLNNPKDPENNADGYSRKESIATIDSEHMILHEDIQKNRENLINRTSWIDELDKKLQKDDKDNYRKTDTLYLDRIEQAYYQQSEQEKDKNAQLGLLGSEPPGNISRKNRLSESKTYSYAESPAKNTISSEGLANIFRFSVGKPYGSNESKRKTMEPTRIEITHENTQIGKKHNVETVKINRFSTGSNILYDSKPINFENIGFKNEISGLSSEFNENESDKSTEPSIESNDRDENPGIINTNASEAHKSLPADLDIPIDLNLLDTSDLKLDSSNIKFPSSGDTKVPLEVEKVAEKSDKVVEQPVHEEKRKKKTGSNLFRVRSKIGIIKRKKSTENDLESEVEPSTSNRSYKRVSSEKRHVEMIDHNEQTDLSSKNTKKHSFNKERSRTPDNFSSGASIEDRNSTPNKALFRFKNKSSSFKKVSNMIEGFEKNWKAKSHKGKVNGASKITEKTESTTSADENASKEARFGNADADDELSAIEGKNEGQRRREIKPTESTSHQENKTPGFLKDDSDDITSNKIPEETFERSNTYSSLAKSYGTITTLRKKMTFKSKVNLFKSKKKLSETDASLPHTPNPELSDTVKRSKSEKQKGRFGFFTKKTG